MIRPTYTHSKINQENSLNKNKKISIIGAALGWGAQIGETEQGPDYIYGSPLVDQNFEMATNCDWEDIIYSSKRIHEHQIPLGVERLPLIIEHVTNIAEKVVSVVKEDKFPIIIGGDHSIAMGTWSGLTTAYQIQKQFGLLWMDAHMDAHTPLTSPSQAYHGMPVASLLGYGESQLTDILSRGPKLKPEHLILYGVRCFEEGEEKLLSQLGVRIYFMNEIIQRGIDETLKEALDYLQTYTAGFGISIDLDVFDPLEVPGVGSPADRGLPVKETLSALRMLREKEGWKGLEITEFNPQRDLDNKTYQAVADIMDTLFHTQDFESKSGKIIAEENQLCAQNYTPLPIVLNHGRGAWVWDTEGRKYLDMLSAYSAVSLGHAHPRILEALNKQAQKVSVISRAFYSDQLAPLLEKLTLLTGLDKVLPMNTGAEAVETAIKAARRWGYEQKLIPPGKAEIIVMDGNFHGRTTTIIGFSSEEDYKFNFGPFAAGFKRVPFGDINSLKSAITPYTCAILTEPMQGESGIIIPPQGWLRQLRALCDEQSLLLILDEVQTGLGRTGKWFSYQHENIKPDGLILGKALGGGVLPVSAFIATEVMMKGFRPGSHGSTFGGNPLAAAVACEALKVLEEENLIEKSATLGAYFLKGLQSFSSSLIQDVRGCGLWAALEVNPQQVQARKICNRLMQRSILVKETHDKIIRFAPPLVVEKESLTWALKEIEATLKEFE